jgi:hypothetical protein
LKKQFINNIVAKKENFMSEENNSKWLEWAREIQALAQTGLTFAPNHYEEARNKRLLEIAAEITAHHTDLEIDTLKKSFMAQPGYATPKVDVRAAVIDDGKILLVKERTDGRWAMPGGWADVGDYPAQSAEREALEESGFIVKAKKLSEFSMRTVRADRWNFFMRLNLSFCAI